MCLHFRFSPQVDNILFIFIFFIGFDDLPVYKKSHLPQLFCLSIMAIDTESEKKCKSDECQSGIRACVGFCRYLLVVSNNPSLSYR